MCIHVLYRYILYGFNFLAFFFASFPLVQFLLTVTDISNGSLAWVASSQGRASAGSRAYLVIESGPPIEVLKCFLGGI